MADIFTPEERLEIDAAKRKFSVPDTPPVDKYAGTGPLGFVTDITNPVYEGAVNTATELSRIIETLWKNATTSDYQRWKNPPTDEAAASSANPLDRDVPYPSTGDTVSDISRQLAQLGFSILPVAKATRFLRPASILGQAAKNTAVFGIAEGLGFSGNTANLADVLKESFPEVESIASEYLASEPSDSMAERKFKNALAAVGVIAPFESMIGIFRLWRKSRINPFIAASNKARDVTPNQKLLEGPTYPATQTVEEIAEQVGMKVPKGVSETKTKPKNTGISRRNFFKVAAGGLAAAAIPGGALKVATEAVAPAVSEAAKFSLGKWIALKKTVNIAMSHVGDPTWSGTANESSDAAFDALEEFESTYSKELDQVVMNKDIEYWKGLEAKLESRVDYTVDDLRNAIAERKEDLMFKHGSDSSKQDLMLYLQERDNTQLDLSPIPSPAPTPPKLENLVPSIRTELPDGTQRVINGIKGQSHGDVFYDIVGPIGKDLESGFTDTVSGNFLTREELAKLIPNVNKVKDFSDSVELNVNAPNSLTSRKLDLTQIENAAENLPKIGRESTAIATTKLTPSETKFLTDLRDNDPVNWKELITDFAPSLQFDGATMTFNESESAGIQQFFEDMVISNQASERLPPSFYKLDFPPFKRTTFSEDESGNVSIKSAGILSAGGVGAAAGMAITDKDSDNSTEVTPVPLSSTQQFSKDFPPVSGKELPNSPTLVLPKYFNKNLADLWSKTYQTDNNPTNTADFIDLNNKLRAAANPNVIKTITDTIAAVFKRSDGSADEDTDLGLLTEASIQIAIKESDGFNEKVQITSYGPPIKYGLARGIHQVEPETAQNLIKTSSLLGKKAKKLLKEHGMDITKPLTDEQIGAFLENNDVISTIFGTAKILSGAKGYDDVQGNSNMLNILRTQ